MYSNNAHKPKKSGGGLGYLIAGAGAAAWWLSKEENRNKFDGWMSQAKDRLNMNKPSGEEFPVHKAGNPDPEDIQDNKMVEEGAQFAVDYYNKKQQ